ncbi:SdpI family protein [Clostridium sp. DL1XJH146]
MFIFSLIITMVIVLPMIGFGLLFMKKPPKEINSIFGYRTRMSSKNKDTWDFAHRYAGRVWFISGIVTAVISTVLIFILKDSVILEKIVLPLYYLQLVVLLLVIPLTEIQLRKVFDKNGNYKETEANNGGN